MRINANIVAFSISFLIHLIIAYYIFVPNYIEPKGSSLNLGTFQIRMLARNSQSTNESPNKIVPKSSNAQQSQTQNQDTPTESQNGENDVNVGENNQAPRELGSEDLLFVKIREEILKATIYPKMSRKNNHQGVTKVKFEVDHNQVKNLQIISQSGYTLLDVAALNAVKKASQNFPKIEENIIMSLDIAFKIIM